MRVLIPRPLPCEGKMSKVLTSHGFTKDQVRGHILGPRVTSCDPLFPNFRGFFAGHFEGLSTGAMATWQRKYSHPFGDTPEQARIRAVTTGDAVTGPRQRAATIGSGTFRSQNRRAGRLGASSSRALATRGRLMRSAEIA
jgi:hypothetical protein